LPAANHSSQQTAITQGFCSVTMSETVLYKIGPWLPWNVNRKSWVADRSVSVSMTLS